MLNHLLRYQLEYFGVCIHPIKVEDLYKILDLTFFEKSIYKLHHQYSFTVL